MGIYAKFIFPRLMELALGGEEIGRLRREALGAASGETLEIGFGTGLNLACYPGSVSRLTAIDPQEMLPERVGRRIAEAPLPVRLLPLDAEGRLPFADASFETVAMTFTLCSITNPARALAEMRRVLAPGGLLLFLEHGRSRQPQIARWQDRLNPLQRLIGAGCNLNRPIDQLIANSGFDLVRLDRPPMPGSRLLGELYLGRGLAGGRTG